MARLARLVVPGLPHHVTQRGNRRQQTFLCDDDYVAYLDLMAEWCGEHGVEIWAYCLMPNHAQLIAVPRSEDGLRLVIGETHRRYTRQVNFREGWRGYLWEGRFASFVMDEPYLLATARYVELNPVRAKLVADVAEWPWSSATAHLAGHNDRLANVAPMLAMVHDWRSFLHSAIREEELRDLRDHGRTGRPLGNADFVDRPQRLVGRTLAPKKSQAGSQNYSNSYNRYCVWNSKRWRLLFVPSASRGEPASGPQRAARSCRRNARRL